jgi:hypothetical protein
LLLGEDDLDLILRRHRDQQASEVHPGQFGVRVARVPRAAAELRVIRVRRRWLA